MASKWESNPSVQRFREYLRIPSVHPDVDYADCVKFLQQQAASLELPVLVMEPVRRKPIVVITWRGLQPDLPSIVLNSHMDVVPVYEEHWTHPPFEAKITSDGWIYGRGTQDMKGVGIQHLEAIRRLKGSGVRLKRTVHILFVPDEETGSHDGMRTFVETEDFKRLNVGFHLDESMPNEEDEIILFNGERITFQFKVICKGEPGHGSLLNSGTAGEKLHFMISKLMELRAAEKRKLEAGRWLGDVTTVNLTQTSGGVQANVLPESLSAVFDIRLVPDINHGDIDDMLNSWCKEAGEGVEIEYVQRNPSVKSTRSDDSNPFWIALKNATDQLGIKVKPVVCPGATDARFIRQLGIPAFGFSPFSSTPQLLHAHDERLHVDVFLRGIEIFERVVRAVANV